MSKSYKISQSKFSNSNMQYRLDIPDKIALKCKKKSLILYILQIFLENKGKNYYHIQCGQNFYLEQEEIHIIELLNSLYMIFQSHHQKFKKKMRNYETNEPIMRFFHRPYSVTLFSESINKILPNFENLLKNSPNIPKKQNEKILQYFVKLNSELKKSTLNKFLESKYALFSWDLNTLDALYPKFQNIQCQENQGKDIEKRIPILKYPIFNGRYIISISQKEISGSYIIDFDYNIDEITRNEIDRYINLLNQKLSTMGIVPQYSLADKITLISQKFNAILKGYFPETQELDRNKIADIVTVKRLHFEKIFVFLQDPNIEEIFLDKKDGFLYFNHQNLGKVESYIQLSLEEVEAIKTHLCLDSRERLDIEKPNITYVYNNPYFHARFCVDIFPSHWQDFGLDIRNLKKNVLTLKDLIELKTLNGEMASFLLLILFFKMNITIVGEVNSGKTTFLNALDLYVPNFYRKIYLEENIETLELPQLYSHQLKYKVSPERFNDYSKQDEIYKLLHRSGDYIILGEILSKMETQALFHCLSTGLKGLQTTHASTINGLINRWVLHYGVGHSCLNDLGVIIFMKKWGNRRIVHSISQLQANQETKEIKINNLFKYCPISKNWIRIDNLLSSPLFQEINGLISLSEEALSKILITLKDFLNKKINKIDGKSIDLKDLLLINKIYREINNSISI